MFVNVQAVEEEKPGTLKRVLDIVVVGFFCAVVVSSSSIINNYYY